MPLSPSQPTSSSVPAWSSNFARARDHISALFHGTSIHTSGPFTSSSYSLKSPCPSEAPRSQGRLFIPQPTSLPRFHSRTPSSTRSVIDPASSPASNMRPITADSYLRLIMSPALALQSTPASPTSFPEPRCEGSYRSRGSSGRRRKQRRRRRHGTWDRAQPSAPKPGSVRRRIYSCLGSGLSLVVVLTICT